MKLFQRIMIVSLFLITMMSCSLLSGDNKLSLNHSVNYYDYLQPSFEGYLQVTEQWLKKNREFISDNPKQELEMNMPFQLGDKVNSDKAILLVHGLGDSPYSFSDIAQSLQQQGFYVQVLLLPGHGSKPQDLMLPNYSDWQGVVDHYASLLKQDFNNVWLGGYSTGANLATIHVIENQEIDGLMLFAPGFQSNVPIIEKFARVASIFVDGYQRAETNLAKYSSSTIQGAIAYTDSASRLRGLLGANTIQIPTLVAISEFDSAVDSSSVRDLYLKYFNNPKNKLMWYGEPSVKQDSIQYFSMQLDNYRISTGSHMSPLFAPSNPYYGISGDLRNCKVNFKQASERRCKPHNKAFWYAAWGYQEEGKKHKRLTWNPYYQALEQEMFNITQ